MLNLKKRHSMILQVASHETEEFRRVAVRRRSKGAVEAHASHTVSCGASGSYRHSGAALAPQSPQRRSLNPGTPLKPQVPPKPADLQTPDKASPHKDLRPTGVSSPVASLSLSGEGKQTNSQRTEIAVLIQVIPAGLTLTPESRTVNGGTAGSGDVRHPSSVSPSPARRSDGTVLLAAPSPELSSTRSGSVLRGLGGARGSGDHRDTSPDGAPAKQAKARTPSPSLWRSGSRRLFTRSRSWVGQSKSAGTRKKEPAGHGSRAVSVLHLGGRSPSADASERTPLTADPSPNHTTTRPPACKKLYCADSSAAIVSLEVQRLSTDPSPSPSPSPGALVPGPGLQAAVSLEPAAPPGGEARAVAGGGGSRTPSEEEPVTLEEGKTHKGVVAEHMDEEHEQDKKKNRESSGEEKLYNIAMELLMTERAYVSRLYLLDQVFCSRLSDEASRGSFPVETVKNIFSNISSIHSFHSKFLLPDLEERMLNWWDQPGLGDILLRHAPFLRMYAEYVGNFDQAMELLRSWRERSTAFRTVLQDIQSQEVCGSLALEHHMLEPVQRVPRYELLLKAYLQKLPEDHPDHPLAQKALEVISMAAGHSNSAIHRAESMKKLLEIFEMVGEVEILHPSTEFLREGRLLKLAARNTSAMDRYLFLFNNFLLCCNPRLSLVGQRYWVRARIGMEAMQVQRTANEEHPHSFRISGKEKTLEYEASSEKERDDWIKVIQEAIDDFHEKNETRKLASKSDGTVPEWELGQRAPRWIRDHEVEECMICHDKFNAITRRRHHCRACGCVVCWKCSDHKAALEYDGKRLNKVCNACHQALSGPEPPATRRRRQRDTVKVPMASSHGVMSSFLTYGDDPMARVRVWSVVPQSQPITLRLYVTQQESSPMLIIPLLGSSVEESPSLSAELQDPPGFILVHTAARHTFLCDSLELKRRWLAVLRKAGTSDADLLPLPMSSTLP